MTGRRVAVVVAAIAASLTLVQAASAAPTRASLMDVESEFMCVVCNEPLAVAQSPQAYRERDFIRTLIAKGETKAQIERAMVAVYTSAVLAKPPAHGFNLTVYVLPPAILVAGIVILAVTLPRWRRRRQQAAAAAAAVPSETFSAAEERRLDEELSRFAG